MILSGRGVIAPACLAASLSHANERQGSPSCGIVDTGFRNVGFLPKITMSTASLKETLLREFSILPADYYPKVLHFIETLKEENDKDVDDRDEADWQEWLRLNPPILIENDPTITPEHLERLRQRFRDMDEGTTKVITFDDDEWEEFCQEVEHSPEEALTKAYRRAHYPAPKQSQS